MATANQDHPPTDARADKTIDLDDDVVQKLTESDPKFVDLSSEAKASCDSHNPSLCGAFIAREYRSASRAAPSRESDRDGFLLTFYRQPQMLSVP